KNWRVGKTLQPVLAVPSSSESFMIWMIFLHQKRLFHLPSVSSPLHEAGAFPVL
ncbi:hypothetical protein BaRGS_00029551, partial [Batillaria attramentaria]